MNNKSAITFADYFAREFNKCITLFYIYDIHIFSELIFQGLSTHSEKHKCTFLL